MRKPELAAAIAEKADLTKDQANRVLNAVLEEITGALNRKDSVTLVGFGTFVQRHRGARTGKNPQTGAPVQILPMVATKPADKFARLHQDLRDRGAARPFDGRLERWAYEPLNETERAARIIAERLTA